MSLESAVCPFWVTPLGPRAHTAPAALLLGGGPRPAQQPRQAEPGSLELPHHPRFTSSSHLERWGAAREAWHASKEAAKGPLMVSGGGARPIARLTLLSSPRALHHRP